MPNLRVDTKKLVRNIHVIRVTILRIVKLIENKPFFVG